MESSGQDYSEWFDKNSNSGEKGRRSVSRSISYDKRRNRVSEYINDDIKAKVDKKAERLEIKLRRALTQVLKIEKGGLDPLPGYFALALENEREDSQYENAWFDAIFEASFEVKNRFFDQQLQLILQDAQEEIEEGNPELNNEFELAYVYAREKQADEPVFDTL